MSVRGKTLYVEHLTVSFDGFKALNELTLQIEPGELRCIIGPNGAGKTTMMDVITGKTRPDSGTVRFGSELNLLALSEPEIAQAGIGRKFQKPTVFERLTVFENLELALGGRQVLLEDAVRAQDHCATETEFIRFWKSSASRHTIRRWEVRSLTARNNGSKSACC